MNHKLFHGVMLGASPIALQGWSVPTSQNVTCDRSDFPRSRLTSEAIS